MIFVDLRTTIASQMRSCHLIFSSNLSFFVSLGTSISVATMGMVCKKRESEGQLMMIAEKKIMESNVKKKGWLPDSMQV